MHNHGRPHHKNQTGRAVVNSGPVLRGRVNLIPKPRRVGTPDQERRKAWARYNRYIANGQPAVSDLGRVAVEIEGPNSSPDVFDESAMPPPVEAEQLSD